MLKLFALISCLFGITISGCEKNDCGNLKGLSENSLFNGGTKSGYDILSLPSDAGTIGIMDSPHYDCKTRNLYFVDLFGQYIFRYSEKLNQFYYASIPGVITPSFFIPTRSKPGVFVMGENNTVYIVQWDGYSKNATIIGNLTTVEQGTNHHTNNAIAGPRGALYFGMLNSQSLCGAPADQGLYRWTRKRGVERLPGSYKTTNSLGYDYERNYLYHLDGCTQMLRRFKVNPKTGKVSEPIILTNYFGLPNSAATVGLSVDCQGNLIIGSYKAGYLFYVNSRNGQIADIIQLPTPFTSSHTFGGTCDNLDRLYVLSGQIDADIQTGTPISITAPPPARSIFVLYGFQGAGVKKPCIDC